jgi:hypothetical protein
MVSLIVAITHSCSTAPPGFDHRARMFRRCADRAFVVVQSDTIL